jgi:D-psicose/D-tagatose/L-ribulose 3-epimerase
MVPWVRFFESLRDVGYDGCITIESFDPDIEGVAKLCCIWRKLADSAEQLATEGLRFLKATYGHLSAESAH